MKEILMLAVSAAALAAGAAMAVHSVRQRAAIDADVAAIMERVAERERVSAARSDLWRVRGEAVSYFTSDGSDGLARLVVAACDAALGFDEAEAAK